MKEREISLVDLIFDILSHWRGIIIAMIIGAVLMGGFSYMQSSNSVEKIHPPVEVTEEEQLEQLEESLTELEKAIVQKTINDEEIYTLQAENIHNSVIMQMDPNQTTKSELIYMIQAEDMRFSYGIKYVYRSLFSNVNFYQWIEEETGIAASDVKHFISMDIGPGMTIVSNEETGFPGSDSMKVTIYHGGNDLILEATKAYFVEQQKMISKDFSAHELVLLSETTSANTDDTYFIDKQIANINNMDNSLMNIAKAKDAFTANQQAYYELLTKEAVSSDKVQEEVAQEPISVSTPSVSMKYVLLGAVLFVLIYVGIIFMLYILNGRLRMSDELQALYQIPQLGTVVKDSKKKFLVDRWIQAARNYGKRQFTEAQSIDLASTAIKISAGKNDMNSVCLMGCDLKAGADKICDKLKAALEKDKIAVTVLDNVLYDAEAMEKLEAVKAVVLVEKAASTMYKEIGDELELVSRQDIKVLGGIVVE